MTDAACHYVPLCENLLHAVGARGLKGTPARRKAGGRAIWRTLPTLPGYIGGVSNDEQVSPLQRPLHRKRSGTRHGVR